MEMLENPLRSLGIDFIRSRTIFPSYFIMIIFLILLSASCVNSLKFVRDDTLDSTVCSSEDTIFSHTVASKIACTGECSREAECFSIFYEPVSRKCTGCLTTYSINDTLQSYPGSLHYKAACPENYVRYRRYCYSLTIFGTYQNGKAECEARGARPVDILDANENQFLKDWIQETGELYVFIGLTDTASEGNWVWETLSSVTFTDWYPGQTNTNTKNCVVFYYYYDYQWMYHTFDSHKMICKQEGREI